MIQNISSCSINYVIATCNTRERRWTSVAEYVLAIQLYHLQCIFKDKVHRKIPNLIKQITIVQPPCKGSYWDNYYDNSIQSICGVPVKYVAYKGLNIDASYDQYLQAVQAFPSFDYYLIIEDDYAVAKTNTTFDIEFVEVFRRLCKDNIGYLATMCETESYMSNKVDAKQRVYTAKIASITNGLISRESFERIGIDNLLNAYHSCFGRHVNNFMGYLVPQERFCLLFHDYDVPHADFARNTDYAMPFFHTDGSRLQDLVLHHCKEQRHKYFIIPTQMTDENGQYTSKPVTYWWDQIKALQ